MTVGQIFWRSWHISIIVRIAVEASRGQSCSTAQEISFGIFVGMPIVVLVYQRAHASEEQVGHPIVAILLLSHDLSGIAPYPGPGTYEFPNVHFITEDLTKVFTEKDVSGLAQLKRYFARKTASDQSRNLINTVMLRCFISDVDARTSAGSHDAS